PEVRDWGREGLDLWRATYPRLIARGSLVVALPRDQAELTRFAKLTERHQWVDAPALKALEPDLAGRFETALNVPGEARMAAADALAFLLEAVRSAGAKATCSAAWDGHGDGDVVIDCRGLGARADLPGLRGVRGERLLIETADVALMRPVRLLH